MAISSMKNEFDEKHLITLIYLSEDIQTGKLICINFSRFNVLLNTLQKLNINKQKVFYRLSSNKENVQDIASKL